ncbi:hypothetical protein AX16_000724 [Volvariella volvacea WC 439]|nr:hypothetical protein AX16_000724 [Volvariella volvacea WC 439]
MAFTNATSIISASNSKLEAQVGGAAVDSKWTKAELKVLRFVNFPGKLRGAADYSDLEKVMPGLRSLHLPPQEKGLDIAEFKRFVKLCPHLQDLAISLDSTSGSPSDPADEVLDHKLRELMILTKCPTDKFKVARNIDNIFPELMVLRGTGTGWDAVQDLLRLCQFARRRLY